MKLVKIFGLVVAVHAAVFVLIFAIPGCRTTARKEAPPVASEPPGAATVSYAGSYGTPAGAPTRSQPAGINATDPAVRPVAAYEGSGIRYSPTRPGADPVPATGGSYGVSLVEPAPEPTPVVTYTVVKGDSLWSVAKKHGVTVPELAAANNLSARASLRIEQRLVIPQKAPAVPAAASTPAATAAEQPRETYTVQSGDTLGAIARRHGTTVAALKSANRLTSDIVRAGQTLVLPSGAGPVAVVEGTATAPVRTGGTITHVVAPGETISEIARHYGVSSVDISVVNNITDPRRLRAGQELTIPGWQAPGGAAAKAPPATPAPAPEAETPTITPGPAVNLIIPGANQALPPAPEESSNVPVIRVEDSPAEDGAPRIE